MWIKNQGYQVSLVFIVQRNDATYLSPNYKRDKIYSDKGVNIYAYKFKWTIKDNIDSCKFIKNYYFICV